MKTVANRCVSIALMTAFLAAPATQGSIKSKKKILGVPKEGQALIYLIREKNFQGSKRTFFVYADDQFLGTVDNNCYAFAHLEPGKRLFWLNFATVNTELEVEAGKTYYLRIFTRIDDVGAEWGRPLIQRMESYCTTEEKEIAKADEYLQERRGRAEQIAVKKSAHEESLQGSDKHIGKWPSLDLEAYSVVYVEDFSISDKKAHKRKDQFQAASAPNRMADRVAGLLEEGPFDEVQRGAVPAAGPGSIIVRADISQYKPGSRTGRALLAGVGSAHLDFSVTVVDGESGKQLTTFADQRTWAWGGVVGESHGIEEMEANIASEIARYLRRCKEGVGASATAVDG